MNQRLIRSDRSLIRSDDPTNTFHSCLAQTPQAPGEQLATDRTDAAWHIGRALQALRAPKLPLCRWTSGPKRYLSISQPGGRPRRDYVPNGVHVQISELIDNFRKMREMINEMRDQRGAPAATRGGYTTYPAPVISHRDEEGFSVASISPGLPMRLVQRSAGRFDCLWM
jgi:hypothetical protein